MWAGTCTRPAAAGVTSRLSPPGKGGRARAWPPEAASGGGHPAGCVWECRRAAQGIRAGADFVTVTLASGDTCWGQVPANFSVHIPEKRGWTGSMGKRAKKTPEPKLWGG